MKTRKILLTGAFGGLGTDIREYIGKEKDETVISSTVDITDRKEIKSLLNVINPDVVIHLAAMVGTKDCEEVPEQAIKANVEGTLNVVEESSKIGAKVVYFSTTAIYKPGTTPIFEDSPIEPYTIYGKTKYWGEEIAKLYVPKNNLLIVRPCFGFGGTTDVSMLGALIRSHFTKKYVNLLLDPEKKKDYTHVRNISHALYLMLKADAFGEDFNVSYGSAIKYGELLKKLENFGISPFYKMFPEKDYMGDHAVSNEKIRRTLGYEPLISLDDGIKMVVNDYVKKHAA